MCYEFMVIFLVLYNFLFFLVNKFLIFSFAWISVFPLIIYAQTLPSINSLIFIYIYSNLKFILETFLLELFILKQIHLKNFFLFIHLGPCWIFVAEQAFLQLQLMGFLLWGLSCCGAQALGLAGSSSCRLWAPLQRSCSAACGIFPDQRLNPCLLHWQVDSLLVNQGSPVPIFKLINLTVSGLSCGLWDLPCNLWDLLLRLAGSVVVVRGLNCLALGSQFPGQGLNLCLLHCKVDSSPLDLQGSPYIHFFFLIE